MKSKKCMISVCTGEGLCTGRTLCFVLMKIYLKGEENE